MRDSLTPWVLALSVFILAACESAPKTSNSSIVADIPNGEYRSLLKKCTIAEQKYDGFQQTFEVHATLLTTAVTNATQQRRAHFLGWEESQLRQERDNAFRDMSGYSKIYLNYFSAVNDYNDLNKANSIWRIYLESNGQRYEGKAEKDKSKLSERAQLYSHVDRFRTPYVITFPIPMTSVEKYGAVLTMTSSLGQIRFDYKDCL